MVWDPNQDSDVKRRPGWSGDEQRIVGFEGYPDWEDWTQQWPGTAAPDPTQVPPAIDVNWEMPFRPGDREGAYGTYTDWASGAGEEVLPLDRFNDAQYLQAFGSLPDAPGPADPTALQDAGYSFRFDPQSTANTDWRLNYDILDPAGTPTGYDLMSTGPYGGFPWVSDPGTPAPPGPNDTDPTQQPTLSTEVTGTGSDPSRIVRPVTELPPDWLGDIQPDYESVPFTPPAYLEQASYRLGDDPLSMLTNANLGSLMTTGGVAPTPLWGNTLNTLQGVLRTGGAEGQALSPMGREVAVELGDVLEAQGATPRTDLAQGLSTSLEDIIASGGVAPTPELGQDVSAQLQNLIATGGALPTDPQREAMEVEAARAPLDVLRRAQLAQGEAALANQGLLGSGAGQEYVERLEERLAPMYTQAAQEIELDRRQREQQRFGEALSLGAQQAQQETVTRDARMGLALDQAQRMSSDEASVRQQQYLMALQQATGMSTQQAIQRENRLQNAMSLATGLSSEQSRNLLATAETVTARQEMMNDVALQMLDRNMKWNQFLAQYGLDRTRIFEDIQRGRIADLLPLLQLYLNSAEIAGQGYVIED